MKPQIICLGGAIIDSIYRVDTIPSTGVKVLPTAAKQLASGMATSAAISIARMGANVELWARIGDDAIGQQFISQLQSESINTDYLYLSSGVATPFAAVLVDAAGERLAVPYYDQRLPSETSWLPLSRVAQSDAVLCDVRWPEGAVCLMREAKRLGVPSVLDADIAPTSVLRELCKYADHVLFSEAALYGLTGDKDASTALRTASQEFKNALVVGVTLGEKGALICEPHSDEKEPIYFPGCSVNVLDTLNAGDIWHGVYTYALAQKKPFSERVIWANTAAAMKCEKAWGWSGAPTLEELTNRIKLFES